MGHPMHQSARDLHHSIGIEIIGTDFEKIDKVYFRDIQTYRQTDSFWANLGRKRAEKGAPDTSIDMGPSPFHRY